MSWSYQASQKKLTIQYNYNLLWIFSPQYPRPLILIDGVIIFTPSTHFSFIIFIFYPLHPNISMQFLQSGIYTFANKPVKENLFNNQELLWLGDPSLQKIAPSF